MIIVEGEIKDAKISSFSSDFQTLIKHKFPSYFLFELLMSLRRFDTSFYGLSFSVFCHMKGVGVGRDGVSKGLTSYYMNSSCSKHKIP